MMNKTYETMQTEEREPGILLITFNRPEIRNAFNTQMGLDLADVFLDKLPKAEHMRVVIITGTGDKAFSAGGDLKQRLGMTTKEWLDQHHIFRRVFDAVLECPIPVIAAVNGAAFGGGCELALGCDFIHAVKGAKFALSEAKLGIMPGGGGTVNLPRVVGPARAKEVAVSARPFTAEQAEAWGMVNGVHERDDLLDYVFELARDIAANGPLAVRQIMKSIEYNMRVDLRTAITFQLECYDSLIATEDRHEGVAAFNERRKPDFKGR
ncbi:MAG: enoyl-CoA hydratase/isomerase family protein [Alphaproteobacteria bacterium]